MISFGTLFRTEVGGRGYKEPPRFMVEVRKELLGGFIIEERWTRLSGSVIRMRIV